MKKLFFLTFFLLLITYTYAQVTNSAGHGEEVPSPACLACPGTDWNNSEYIAVADGKMTISGLNSSAFCFMSTCFYSRFLYASHFNFSIPVDATIDSIFVDIKRTAIEGDVIRDSIVQLHKGDSLVGDNLQSSVFWPKTLAYESYGHNIPLWGTTWIPSEINDSTFGIALKVMNLDTVIAQAGVDHIQMTVYYSTTNGIYSVTSSPTEIEWINSPGEIQINFLASSSEKIFSKIYNSFGQEVKSFHVEQSIIGENNFHFSSENLPSGIYFLTVNIGGNIYTRKFIALN